MKKIEILWDKFDPHCLNCYQTNFYTSLGELDFHNCTNFSSLYFEVLKQTLTISFTKEYPDLIMQNLKEIKFCFQNVRSFSFGRGFKKELSKEMLNEETCLMDLAILKNPLTDKAVHLQFEFGSKRTLDILAKNLILYVEENIPQ